MTGDVETLTSALRRLTDERASGVLTIGTGSGDVAVVLADGATTGIGPPPPGGDPRLAPDAAPGLVAAAAVDTLVERLVEAVVARTGTWTFDATAPVPATVPTPPDLGHEVTRRAVDAGRALGTAGPDAVLVATAPAGGGDEAARTVLPLLDGSRSVAEVADAIGRPVSAVATIAAGLLEGGRAALAPDTAQPQATPTPPATPAAASTPAPGSDPWATVDDEDDGPDMWVMTEDEQETDDQLATDAPVAGDGPPAGVQLTSTLTSDDVAGDDWADTSWLDQLDEDDEDRRSLPGTTAPVAQDAPPADAPATDDGDWDGGAATEFAALFDDLDAGRSSGAAAGTESSPSGAAPAPAPEPPADPTPPAPAPPKRPTGDVSEFLRELSRLALEEDD